MTTNEKLDQITAKIRAEIKTGILPQTIKARLITNGASHDLATKLLTLAELEVFAETV
jgi:hypothetical protein